MESIVKVLKRRWVVMVASSLLLLEPDFGAVRSDYRDRNGLLTLQLNWNCSPGCSRFWQSHLSWLVAAPRTGCSACWASSDPRKDPARQRLPAIHSLIAFGARRVAWRRTWRERGKLSIRPKRIRTS